MAARPKNKSNYPQEPELSEGKPPLIPPKPLIESPDKKQNEAIIEKPVNQGIKRIEFASRVVEINEDSIKVRSLTNTPLRGRPSSKSSVDKNIASQVSSPVYSICNLRNRSVDKDYPSKRILSTSGKKPAIEENCQNTKNKPLQRENSEKFEAVNEKKNFRPIKRSKTHKNLHRTSCERGKCSPCGDRPTVKDKDPENLAIRLKIPQEIIKKSKPRDKKSTKNEGKTVKNKKILEETPTAYKSKKPSIEHFSAKSPKAENLNKLKFHDKRKVITTRGKMLKPSLKTPKNKKMSEEIQILYEKGQKKVKFNDFRETEQKKEFCSSSDSSLSCSETAEWVNLNCDQFIGKTSDFVGEFIQKITVDNQLLKDHLRRSVEETKTQTEECSGSSYSETAFELPKIKDTDNKTKSVPLLKLAAIQNKKSDSSRYYEQDGIIYDSSDSIFQDVNHKDNKNSTTKSAREAINYYKNLKFK